MIIKSEAFNHFVHKLQDEIVQITHQKVVESYGIRGDKNLKKNLINMT